MKDKFKFLIEYGLEKKIKSKWFVIVNILLLVLMLSLCNIDRIITFFGGDFNKETKILVVDNIGCFDLLKSQFDLNKDNLSKYSMENYKKDLKSLKKEIKKDDNTVGIILNPNEDKIIDVKIISNGYLDLIDSEYLKSIIYSTKIVKAIEKYDIPIETINKIYENVEIDREILGKNKKKEEENMEMVMAYVFPSIILPLFMLILLLVQMIGSEINDEKATRGMEIIISNVSPKIHFFSKIIVSNLFIIIQILLMLFYGVLGMLIRGKQAIEANSELYNYVNTFKENISIQLTDKLIYVIPLFIILLILTFIGYSLLSGILASITTNIEDFQQLQTPLMIILMTGYVLSVFAATFDGSLLIKLIAFLPFISAIVAPSLFIIGQFSLIDMIISIVLMLGVNYILIKYGLRIYKVGILNYSSSKLYKKMWKAVKEK
jgi:ABC-2 type transport system permease protein